MKTTILVILILTLSQATFARNGQENEGLPAPGSKKVEITCDSEDGAVSLQVKRTAAGKTEIDVTVESTGGAYPTYRYSVKEDRHPGVLGSGLDYSGRGINLHLNTDWAPRPEGIASDLNVTQLGIENQTLYCRFE